MTLCGLPPLIAQTHPVMHLGDRFRPGQTASYGPTAWLILLGVVGGLVLIGLAVQVISRRRQRLRHSPWRLFRDLCTAHQLTRGQRQLLQRLAQLQQLAQPALLFLDPRPWDLTSLGQVDAPTRHELESLQRQLFAPR